MIRGHRLKIAAVAGVLLLCGCADTPAPGPSETPTTAGPSTPAAADGTSSSADSPLSVLTLPAADSDGPDAPARRVGTYSHTGDRPDLLRFGTFAADDDGCLLFLEDGEGSSTPPARALALPEGTRVTPDGALRIPVRQVDSAPDSTVTVRVGDEVQGGGAELTLDQARSEAYAVAVPEGCYADPSMRVFLFEASEPTVR